MAKLHYFQGRGRATIVRLTLAACDIQFADVFYTERSQYLKVVEDGTSMFNQLPFVELDGKVMVQSNAIVRYLARRHSLYGKDDEETTLIDQIYDGGRDFLDAFIPIGFRPEAEVLAELKDKILPKFMPCFEKLAAGNGSGFLVAKCLTIADLSLLEPLLAAVEYFGPEVFNDYPALKKFYDNLTSIENIKSFINGPQRQRKNDEEYVTSVKKVLNK